MLSSWKMAHDSSYLIWIIYNITNQCHALMIGTRTGFITVLEANILVFDGSVGDI